jgi:hypothetical protein
MMRDSHGDERAAGSCADARARLVNAIVAVAVRSCEPGSGSEATP